MSAINNYIIFIFFFLVFASINGFSQNKNRIAVMDLEPEGISLSESRIISARLRTDLINTNKFIVLEREKMDEILNEQSFQLSGCTSTDCVVEAGKLLGVNQIVAGNIGKLGNLFTISIRLIDVKTGQILKTATEDCKCGIEDVLSTSVRNVVLILSGKKVDTSSYINRKNSLKNNEINDWELLGISRKEYIEYKTSGLNLKEWYIENKKKNIKKALYLSLFIPGLGQYYNGDYFTGIFQQSLIALSLPVVYHNLIEERVNNWEERTVAKTFIVLDVSIWIWSIYDAKSSAEKYNKKFEEKLKLLSKSISLHPYLSGAPLSKRNKKILFGFTISL